MLLIDSPWLVIQILDKCKRCSIQLVTDYLVPVLMKRLRKFVLQHHFCRNAIDLDGFLRFMLLQAVMAYVYVFFFFIGALFSFMRSADLLSI